MKDERPRFEVADVLRRLRERGALPQGLSLLQRRVVGALIACRTATLGGHLERCDDCSHERPAYNSCRNRHCPKCQGPDTARWLEEHRALLLPVPYAHAVFTLPHVLAPLALQNARLLYGFLFRASAHALLELAASPGHLGGQLGFLSILHTWGQKLTHHPHVHCLIPAGVLAAASTTSEAMAPASETEGNAPGLEAQTAKRCPHCQRGTLRFVDPIPPARHGSGKLALFDSS